MGERIAIQLACQERVLRTAAFADANDAAALADCYTEDAVLLRPNGQPLEGRDAIRGSYEQRPADRTTRHLVTNTLVDVESPTRAHARSYVVLWTASAASKADASGARPAQRQAVGEFEDRLERSLDGCWLISRRDARFVLYRDA